jgi:hypothetical protein
MKAEDLPAYWAKAKGLVYCKGQVSVRLTIANKNRIDELCLRFPRRTRTVLINDLLGFSLDLVDRALLDARRKLKGDIL